MSCDNLIEKIWRYICCLYCSNNMNPITMSDTNNTRETQYKDTIIVKNIQTYGMICLSAVGRGTLFLLVVM